MNRSRPGFNRDDDVLGRPVDLLVLEDGLDADLRRHRRRHLPADLLCDLTLSLAIRN